MPLLREDTAWVDTGALLCHHDRMTVTPAHEVVPGDVVVLDPGPYGRFYVSRALTDATEGVTYLFEENPRGDDFCIYIGADEEVQVVRELTGGTEPVILTV